MPRPVLQAMVLADNVYQDRTTGKFIIAGTFSRLGITRRIGPPIFPAPAAPPAGQPVVPQGASPAPDPAASLLENPPPMYASATPIAPPPAPETPIAPPAMATPAAPQAQLPPQPQPPGAPPQETTTFRNAAELTRAVSTAGSPHLYVALTDVHRTIPLKVRFVCLSDIMETAPRFEIGLEVNSADPLAVVELTIPMPRLPVTGAGTFSLDLMYQGEILGSWRIVVTEETIQG
jgi:hypothetical protein